MRVKVMQVGPPPPLENSERSTSMTSIPLSISSLLIFRLNAGTITLLGETTKIFGAHNCNSSSNSSIISTFLSF